MAVLVGALAVLAVCANSSKVIDPDGRMLAITLAALLVASELRPVRHHAGALDFTASWVFAGALVLVAPPLYAVGALAVGALAGDTLAQKAPHRVLFNAATLVTSLGVGMGVLEAFGARTTLVSDGGAPPAFLLACVAFAAVVFAVNLVLVATMLDVETGLGVRRIVRRLLPQSVLDDLLLLVWAPVLAVVGLRSEFLIVLPLLGVVVIHERLRQRTRERWPGQLSDVFGHAELVGRVAEAVPHGVTVVVIDLDGLGEICTRLGPDAGDRVQEIVEERLRRAVGSDDVVTRTRADQFTVVVESAATQDTAPVERIERIFSRPMEIDGVPVPVRSTIGVATAPADGTDASELLETAQDRLFAEKLSRRSSADRDEVSTRPVAGGLPMLRDLREALRRNELVVVYQPQVSLSTGATVGFEALVRWQHRDGGTIMPSDFVYAAEHTDLIGELTSFVLEESLGTCARWWQAGHRIPVSVNVSVRSLTDLGFVSQVRSLLIDHRLPGSALEVEYTESALLLDLEGARETLAELAELGVAVAIDDFGTGYSSFEHLRRLPVNRLKIDRSFVGHLDTGLDSRFVAPMIVLGHNLGLSVVAEGVEQPEEHEALRQLGCDAAQGWHFARPLPASATLHWLDPIEEIAVGT